MSVIFVSHGAPDALLNVPGAVRQIAQRVVIMQRRLRLIDGVLQTEHD